MILGLLLIIGLFALLVRSLTPSWGLPLYVLFVVLSVLFVGWERRRIAERRRALERELHKERLSLGNRLRKSGSYVTGEEE